MSMTAISARELTDGRWCTYTRRHRNNGETLLRIRQSVLGRERVQRSLGDFVRMAGGYWVKMPAIPIEPMILELRHTERNA